MKAWKYISIIGLLFLLVTAAACGNVSDNGSSSSNKNRLQKIRLKLKQNKGMSRSLKMQNV